MNWQAISFDWNQVRAFLATAEEGSLSGAARALNTTQPTIGRQITALEGTLGVTLVERSVRGLTLTQAGRDLLDHVRAMGEAATLISMAAEGQALDVSGEVAVTATDLLSAVVLPDVLWSLRQTAPGLRVRIIAANDIQNLTRREADIAIRHVRPAQQELIARHIGDFKANLYAANTYLERLGRPRAPEDLGRYSFIGNADPVRLMPALEHRGIDIGPEHFVMSSDSGIVVWELVKRGYGIAMLPQVLCDAEPGIEEVLPGLTPLEFPIWLVTHRELRTNPRIRLVFDTLAAELAARIGRRAEPRDARTA